MASIEKRGKNSWRLVVEAGYDTNGKRIKRTKTIRIEDPALLKTTRKLREYLEEELLKFKLEVEAGEYIAPQKMTLSAFVEEWEKKYAVKHLSESTLETYIGHINNHILPALGHMRLDQVKPMHVVNFLDTLTRKDGKEKELSVGTIQYIYRVLRNIFSRAVEWKLIKENPVASIKRPSEKGRREVNVYDEEEVTMLLEAAQNEPFMWRMFITLALAAGMRRGELLGLEWGHVDLEKGVIHVKQELIMGRNANPILKPHTKNKKTRVVSISPSVVEELKEYKRHWKKEKLKNMEIWKEFEHEFLFCKNDGTHLYPTTPTAWWRKFTERSGVRYIRLHDLRHTSATLLINQGVHAKIISERLGHADIRITMDTYGHALQSADREAANKLDALFRKKGG